MERRARGIGAGVADGRRRESLELLFGVEEKRREDAAASLLLRWKKGAARRNGAGGGSGGRRGARVRRGVRSIYRN